MAGMGQDLVVNLAGNNAKLKKSLVEGKSSLTDFAASATSLLNPVTVAFATIAASAAAAGLSIYGIGQRIESLAGIADKAAQTGLSGEFIQQLAFAADQSGQSVDGLLGGLEKMTIALGKAELHTEETAKAFEQIGLSATDLAAMKPEDQFLTIADAIAKLPSAAEKAAASVAIFGKSSMDMVPLLGEGEKGIRALMQQAKDLKIGISDEDLKSIATADDAMQRMKSSLSSVVSNIAVGMAPLFQSISDTITTITPQIAEVARAISGALSDAINIAVKLFNDELMPGIKSFLEVSSELLTKWSDMPDKFSFAGEMIKAIFDVAFEYIKVYWSIMLDDMIAATAEAAGKMLNMLNPKTGFNAVSDWLTGQEAAKIDPRNETAQLDAAQARLDALITRLQTGAAPPVPGLAAEGGAVVVVPPVPTMTGQPSGPAPGSPADIFGRFGGGFKPPMVGGKDPNVTATEKQTKALLDGLKPPSGLPLAVVTSF